MGLRFYQDANASHYLDLLLQAAHANSEKFDVYTHEMMPEPYHFSNSPRIAPIWIVPKVGYVLTNHEDDQPILSKGVRAPMRARR